MTRHRSFARSLALLTGGAVLAACGSVTETSSESQTEPSVTVVGDTAFLVLPLGRTADNGELAVTFEGVSEDSRCPIGVMCVWEGNASIRLTLASGGDTQAAILNSTLDPKAAAFAGYTIGYRDLTPYPEQDAPWDPDAYVARIYIYDGR